MLLLILISFSLLVILIALFTAKLNVKVPCAHNWVEEGNNIRCTKCFRTTTKVINTKTTERNLSAPLITTSKGIPLAYDEADEAMEDALLAD